MKQNLMRKFILIIFILIIDFEIYSQTSINKVDKNGLKQGIWVKTMASNIVDTMYYQNDKLNGPYKSYFIKSGIIRSSGEYSDGKKIGIWKDFDKGRLIAEETDRGFNNDSVCNESGKRILPTFYSHIRLYDNVTGSIKSEGKVLYFDSWDSDFSNEHGLWKYFNSNGDTIAKRFYDYGRIINNNVR
jgi:antitoxin component YwqK of YwqJK toxin-antitoxin module